MNKGQKKPYIDEDEDYIIENDDDIDLDPKNNYNINKQKNNNTQIYKMSNKQNNNISSNKKTKKNTSRSAAAEMIKNAKEKYKEEQKIKENQKIKNFDDIPVGGVRIAAGVDENYGIDIKVPTKKNTQNYNTNSNYILKNEEMNLKKNLTTADFDNNNYYNDNNNKNIERKNSYTSMVTQTCDREMVGRSEFVGIPIDNINNPSNQIDIKQKYSSKIIENHNNDINNPISRMSEFNRAENLREKTEVVIQLQNAQRELDNEIEMNKRLQSQIDNYKGEFNNLRVELVKKSDTINELQQKISKFERELYLQGKKLIEAEAKPSQEHYEDIVHNYEELKKNFEKAIDKIKSLSNENEDLKEKLIKLNEINKNLRKELKNTKEKSNYNNSSTNDIDNNNEVDIYDNNDFNNIKLKKNDSNNNLKEVNPFETKSKLYEEPQIINRQSNEDFNKIEENKEQKKSIIPQDNDIFNSKDSRYIQPENKPRKIQEDGIPVIKRVEEKDNVRDLLVNNYALNDDDFYNRPVGKPKVKRIKRENKNNLKSKIEYNNGNNDENTENSINNNSMVNNNTGKKTIAKEISNKDFYNTNNANSNISKIQRNTIAGFNNKITKSLGVFPSQVKSIANEKEILELEDQLYNLQKERDRINDEYLKFPEFPKKREEINAKRKIEIKLEEMNKEIHLNKLKIRELKDGK